MANDKDNAIENKIWGLAWGADGQWYWKGRLSTLDGAAAIVAEACGYRKSIVTRALEAALLEEPLSLRDTLNAVE